MAKEKKKSKLFHRQSLRMPKDVTLNLPVTYRQLFKFTYRTNLTLLFRISITLSVFAIPLLIALYFRGAITAGITNSSTPETLTANIMSFQSWYGFVLFACFLILSFGLAGVFYVMKRHLQNEGVKYWRDLFYGIKTHGLKIFGMTFFYFGILTVLNYIINLFSFPSDVPYYAILLVIFIILQCLFFMQYTISIMTIIIYTCPFFKNLKNAFLMVFSKFPLCVLSLLCTVAPGIIVLEIGFAPVTFAFLIIYICLGFAHCVHVISLFNLYIFDECVNKRQFPEAYRKGLFQGEQVQPIDEGFHK